jgi:hypothetical protein
VAKTISHLPTSLTRALQELETKQNVMIEALQRRFLKAGNAKTSESQTAQRVMADRAEDAVWSAFHDWLQGWTKLSDYVPQVQVAQTLYLKIFPERLKFTRLPYKIEWSEIQARLELIEKEKLGSAIQQLGGGLFLETIVKIHKEYGEILGITHSKQLAEADSGTSDPSLKESFLDLASALRRYVLQVAAFADHAHPDTVQCADQLLSPLSNWETRKRNSSREGKPVNNADGNQVSTDGPLPSSSN